jgi:hypothetical protein
LLQFAGFDEKELVKFWDEEKDTKDDKFNVDKELKENKTPQTKLGDLIVMGNHKLLCASSTDINAVKNYSVMIKLLLSTVTHLSISGFHMTKVWVINRNYGGSFDDNQSPEAYKEFIRQVLKSSLAVSTKDTHVAFWCDEAWVWVFKRCTWNSA